MFRVTGASVAPRRNSRAPKTIRLLAYQSRREMVEMDKAAVQVCDVNEKRNSGNRAALQERLLIIPVLLYFSRY